MDKKIPKYLTVEKHLTKKIRSMEANARIPGERVLAKALGISYMTVRKAIDNLVTQGALYRIPTKGTYVASVSDSKTATQTIGYFLDREIHSGVSSPYYSMIFRALERVATEKGYSLLFFSDATASNFNKTLAKLDGVIASCFPRIEPIIEEIKNRMPVVVIDNAAADRTVPSVIIDNFTAVKDSLSHLYALGHRRVGFMTGLDDSDVGRNRLTGYESGLKFHQLNFDASLVYRGNYSYNAGIEGMDYFFNLATPPTAVLCANDSMALGAMRQLAAAGIALPSQFSIMGFDDIEIASQIVPALSTVRAPIDKIANSAFALLEDLMHQQAHAKKHIELPAEPMIRQTTAAVNSSIVAA